MYLKFFRLGLAALAAALCLSAGAMAQTPTFRLCTGLDSGNYFKAGHLLKKMLSNTNVEVLTSQGSLENLDRIVKGECDGAFVQSDAMLVYASRNARALSAVERAGILYQEHAHMLCNRQANVDRIVDLRKNHTVAVGPDGTGARTTWAAFVLADEKRYKVVNIDTRAGVRALSAVADGTDVQCLLWIGALGSSFMKVDAQQHGDRIVLVGTDDRDMANGAKDSRGKALYEYGEIPPDTYPRIQPKGSLYGTKTVNTIKLDALFVANSNWINANSSAYDGVLRGFAATKPAIEDLIRPK